MVEIIIISRKQYDKWLVKCSFNKTGTSWVYWSKVPHTVSLKTLLLIENTKTLVLMDDDGIFCYIKGIKHEFIPEDIVEEVEVEEQMIMAARAVAMEVISNFIKNKIKYNLS